MNDFWMIYITGGALALFPYGVLLGAGLKKLWGAKK